uniref:LRRCT domain-containing protein n=1 Tax=Ciona savignyi TaxID=51511 RepID=H2YHD1_CIOSA
AVAITPLKNLRRFIAEGNRIRDFPFHATFPLLFLLNLSNNSIPELPQNAFQGCPRLTELDLSSNSITKVAPLSNLLHLETINLENNQLETLPDMSSLIKLKETLLDKNPWKCDCGLQDFRRWIEITETDVICDSPSTLKGTSLKSLEIEDLICATVPPTPQFVNITQNHMFF